MKKVIPGLVVSVLLALPFSAMGVCLSGVAPGEYDIELGKYNNWNSKINVDHCDEVNFDCTITQSHTIVGNTTESVDTRNKLEALTNKLGEDCLDKAAVLNDKGQQGFVDVYPDDLGYQGTLWEHFEDEANKCWNHYVAIFNNKKDDMCIISVTGSQ